MRAGRLASAGAALVLGLAVPATALAHPLGNFTINHYAGIRVAPDEILLDVVIDMAEIPTFQQRQRLDTDGDGSLSPAEIAAERSLACGRLAPSLALAVDGRREKPAVVAAGLSFRPGAGGLDTMRLVCEFETSLPVPLAESSPAGLTVTFADTSYSERIGWREIVVAGDGVTIAAAGAGGGASEPQTVSVSGRLTSYPTDLLSQPLDMRSVEFRAAPGGPRLPAWSAPDAAPVSAPGDGTAPGVGTVPGGVGAVPGGVGNELASLIGTADLTLPVVLASLLIALGLGAIHAVSPGHGKTVMAAYLVGSRGSARHAVALGVTVTIAHTLGVLALAAITLLASSVLPPERLYPILGLASGGIAVAIGAWLLLARYRQWAEGHARSRHEHDHEHEHEHEHEHHPASGLHSHGGVTHSHLPATGTTLSWRSLFALGLSGGLVPSASALILLLGSIAAGRPEFGLVLVVAFGLGMAMVLGGVGLALVYAGRLLERLPSTDGLRRLSGAVPTATAVVVLVAGLFLTSQALTQVF